MTTTWRIKAGRLPVGQKLRLEQDAAPTLTSSPGHQSDGQLGALRGGLGWARWGDQSPHGTTRRRWQAPHLRDERPRRASGAPRPTHAAHQRRGRRCDRRRVVPAAQFLVAHQHVLLPFLQDAGRGFATRSPLVRRPGPRGSPGAGAARWSEVALAPPLRRGFGGGSGGSVRRRRPSGEPMGIDLAADGRMLPSPGGMVRGVGGAGGRGGDGHRQRVRGRGSDDDKQAAAGGAVGGTASHSRDLAPSAAPAAAVASPLQRPAQPARRWRRSGRRRRGASARLRGPRAAGRQRRRRRRARLLEQLRSWPADGECASGASGVPAAAEDIDEGAEAVEAAAG